MSEQNAISPAKAECAAPDIANWAGWAEAKIELEELIDELIELCDKCERPMLCEAHSCDKHPLLHRMKYVKEGEFVRLCCSCKIIELCCGPKAKKKSKGKAGRQRKHR